MPRSVGKGLQEPCLVCDEQRFTEMAHFPTPQSQGGQETIPLCPLHHKLLDKGRISRMEVDRIRQASYADQFDSAEELVEWAAARGYPYTVEDLDRKFWHYLA